MSSWPQELSTIQNHDIYFSGRLITKSVREKWIWGNTWWWCWWFAGRIDRKVAFPPTTFKRENVFGLKINKKKKGWGLGLHALQKEHWCDWDIFQVGDLVILHVLMYLIEHACRAIIIREFILRHWVYFSSSINFFSLLIWHWIC